MIQIRIYGLDVSRLPEVRDFFRLYIDKEVTTKARGDLVDVFITDDVPVILKVNYPEFVFDLGGHLLSIENYEFVNMELK